MPAGVLALTVLNDEWAPVVVIGGRLDLSVASRVRQKLTRLSRFSTTLIVDLTEVSFMDSAGLGVLVFVQHQLARAGGRLILVGVTPELARVFESTSLDGRFTMASTRQEALQQPDG